MPRFAGDESTYTFRMMRKGGPGGRMVASDIGFDLDSVTTIINATIPKPFSAGAWYGYRMALEGVAGEYGGGLGVPKDSDVLEKRLSQRGKNPNQQLDVSRNRGNVAHDVLELLATGKGEEARALAEKEVLENQTAYGKAVVKWWDEKGSRTKWRAEQPVFSLKHGYAGTADLIANDEVIDLKTHKPMVGFTKDGKGPAYLGDLIQLRAYRLAWTEMQGFTPARNRILIARPNGNYLEDEREVPESLWLQCLAMYRELKLT